MAANAEQRRPLSQEGLNLAALRRVEFKKLIISDPQRALEEAVRRVVRQELPPEIVALLEKPVSARGDFNVYFGKPQPGVTLPADFEPVMRYFETAEGESYKARVYESRIPQTTQRDVVFRGVAIDRELAVHESPVRELEIGERISPESEVVEQCPVSGQSTVVEEGKAAPITAETPAVEVAGRIIRLCNGTHARVLDESYRQASGGPGGAHSIPDNFPGTSAEAIGNFRALYIRVTYPDQLRAPNTESEAYGYMRDVTRYFLDNSFGKMSTTTTVTPLVVLPHTKAWYVAKDAEVDGLGLVHSHARAEARRLGYDSNIFTVTIVRVNSGPRLDGISWGGGDSVWLSWDGMDVINHEAGHSIGRGHANFWDTNGQSAIGDGVNDEYGNGFDVMGGGNGFSAHYNTIAKRALAWLPDGAIHQPTQNGIFRIHAYDQPVLEEGKRYAIRIAKDSGRFYHVEYHKAYGEEHSSANALKNSALLIWHWAALGNNGHLIDTTPGTSGGKNDGGIEVGRTFSDFESGLHFTVVGKNPTTPESLDIAVQRGPFAGNDPPTVSLNASATNVASNASITFTAAASDADGDALSYHWDCGDGYFSENSSVFTRVFTTPRQYTIHCSVSDMKGGLTRRQVVVSVGSPSGRTVTGQVTAAGPLQGVLIKSSSGQHAYTDADGAYALSNVPTGSRTISALLYGFSFTPEFTNPLVVGTGANVANFSAASVTEVTLEATADATEGGANGLFALTRTGATSNALTVRVMTATGTAERTVDYNFNPAETTEGNYRNFVIPAGAATLPIAVQAVNDASQEGPETVTLQVANGATYITRASGVATLVVNDNDTALPKVSITASDDESAEAGGNPASFVILRTGPLTSALTVGLQFSGTATRGSDYPNLPVSVTIPAGEPSLIVALTPTDDAAVEPSESCVVTLASSGAYVRDPAAQSATAVIYDDETPVLTITALDPNAAEAGRDPGVFLISRTGLSTQSLKVYYGLGGSASQGTDYQVLPAEVTIPAGADSVPVYVTPYDDAHGEAAETVELRLTTFGGAYSVGHTSSATVTIADNSDPPLVTVGCFSASIAEPNDTGSFRFRVTGSVTGSIIVNYTISGTATPGVDYTGLTGSVTIPGNGANNADVTVTPLNDLLKENVETIIITLTPGPNYTIYNEGLATGLLRDDDAPTVNITPHRDTLQEPSTASSFHISRSDADADPTTAGALTVNYTVAGTAANGTDYAMLTGAVTIADGQAGIDISVMPVDDALFEGAETITVTLTDNAAYSVGVRSASLVLTDNETLPISLGFETAVSSTSEAPDPSSGPHRLLNVTLSAASTDTITVEYEAWTAGSGATATGDGVDWNFVDGANGDAFISSGVLTFAPGVISQAVKLRVADDGVIESPEIAAIRLKNASFSRVSTSRGTHSLTINDNAAANPLARVAFLTAASATAESSGSAFLMVSLDRALALSASVSYAVSGGTATANEDFTLAPGTLTFAAGETAKLIELRLTNDSALEGAETAVVQLASPLVAELGARSSHIVTIQDDNAPTVSVVASDPEAGEPSEAAQFTISRSGGALDAALTINYTVAGTAGAADYQAMGGSVTLEANQLSDAIAVMPIDDSETESDETVILALAAHASYNIDAGHASASVTLRDDDSPPLVSILSPVAPSAAIPAGVGLVLQGIGEKYGAGGPVAVDVAWTRVSGLGAVTFGNAAAVNTTARFSLNGSYVLRLTGTAGSLSAFDEVSVTVGVPVTTPAASTSDVGVTQAPGSWSERGGVHTLRGAGSGLSSTGSSDGFFFVAAARSGNFDLRCRMVSIVNPGGSGSCRAGLMARASDAPDAMYALTLHKADGPHSYNYRLSNGVATQASQGTTNYTFPRWIRLVRNGDSFSAYHSADGNSWTQRGSTQTIAMGTAPLVGLAITSAEPEEASTATFDNLAFPLHANVGPLVDAGTVTGTGPFTLDGTVADDGLPLPVSLNTAWQQASGPGTAAFADASVVDTTVSVDSSGSYVVRLSANDSAVATFDDATFSATVDNPPIEIWRAAQFGPDANNPTIAGDDADPDGDGLSNLIEYALNLDPHTHSQSQLPVSSRDETTLWLTYRKRIGATDVTLLVQGSQDLNSWSAAGISEVVVSDDDGETQVIRASISTALERRYLRVRVTH